MMMMMMIQFHSFPGPMPPDPQYSRPRRWSSCALSRLTRVFNPPVTMYLHCKLQLLSAEPVEAPPVPPVGKQGASHLYLGEATNSLAPALTVANVWSIHRTSTYNHHSSHTHTGKYISHIYAKIQHCLTKAFEIDWQPVDITKSSRTPY